MAKFSITQTATASVTMEIEADTLEEALTEMREEGVPPLCAQCSGRGQSHTLEVDDAWEIEANSVYVDNVRVPRSEVEEAENNC